MHSISLTHWKLKHTHFNIFRLLCRLQFWSFVCWVFSVFSYSECIFHENWFSWEFWAPSVVETSLCSDFAFASVRAKWVCLLTSWFFFDTNMDPMHHRIGIPKSVTHGREQVPIWWSHSLKGQTPNLCRKLNSRSPQIFVGKSIPDLPNLGAQSCRSALYLLLTLHFKSHSCLWFWAPSSFGMWGFPLL